MTIRQGPRRRPLLAAAACALGLALAAAAPGCESSDPTAPADSVITVSADPQTVVVPSGGSGTATITARLRSKNGSPLPDQEMTFSTTQGTLDPPAESLLTTDDDGQALSVLTTSSPATVTARSGSISGTTQVNTAQGNLSQFLLNISPVQELLACNDTLTFTAEVRTTAGDPVEDVLVCFIEATANTIAGNFNPGDQEFTDSSGEATVTWTPGSQCNSRCTAAGDPNGGGVCSFFFSVDDCNGNFESQQEQVTDRIN